MRILIPLDGSPLAEFAVGLAAQLARHMVPTAELVLAHLAPVSARRGAARAITGHCVTADRPTLGVEPMSLAVQTALAKVHLRQHVVFYEEDIAAAICAQALEAQADLIVMGCGTEPVLLSERVVKAVVQLAHVPTLLLRQNALFRTDHDMHLPFTILVGLDGSAKAEAALPPAIALARPMRGTIRLCHVLPPYADIFHLSSSAAAEQYLGAVQLRVQRQGVPTEISLCYGDPARQILWSTQYAGAKCDMVALATHGHTGIEQHTLGRVADEVIQQALCPLLIVQAR